MRKKLVITVLACALCSSLFSGCGSNAKKDVTLVIKTPCLPMNSISQPEIVDSGDFLQQAGAEFAAQYQDANVTIRVESFEYVDEVAAITDSFDTADATDVLYEGYFNMASYLHTGRVVPLDDIISDEMQSDIDAASWTMSTANGKTYMMPFLSMQNILIYNKELFQACGLEKYIADTVTIQNWTMEEWTDILDTLAAGLPDQTYPMMMYGKNNQGDTHIMSYIRAFGSTIFDADGHFDLESEAAVEALTWIQSGVDKGWYPPHPENIELSDCTELFSNGQLAIYIFNNANFILYDNIEDYGFVNFPGNVATSFVTGFEVFDNGDEAKLQAAKAFVRFIYENDKWLEMSSGNLPVSKRISEKYQDQITMLDEFTGNSVNVVDFMNNSPNWQGNDTSVRSVFWPHIHDLLAKSTTPQECAKRLDEACNIALDTGWENSILHE
ncbi:MAG: extracellular solute-binding protein [Muribaculaceae bacterium]|nr:extracellular solute-binding protein [Muribaculaceae bacterium]MCM1494087.1 extracellular solute-binding protein [Muribaculaceae bacterium]MCM1561350.1 extracellular solute-binding protein [Butyrivibrio sp.]